MSAGDRTGLQVQARGGVGSLSLFVAVVLLLGVLVALGVVATGTTSALTDANESSPPELHSGEKLNTTAVELLFVDEEGMNASSIDTDDFLLSDGDLSNVRTTAQGTNATATLVLAEPIQADELTVGIATDSDIQDVAGTRIQAEDSPSVTVSGMDGAPPQVLGTSVGDARGGPAEIEFRFDEPVSALTVEITGPVNVTLDIDDFENPRANRYVTEYEPPESGEYRVNLSRITDEAGNTGNPSIARVIEADRSDPEAVIGIDFGKSSGTSIAFDASQSAGDRLNYTWEFGDETNASGDRVSHEFSPEEHTITLTVEDEFGNADQDRLDLDLTDGLDSGEDVAQETETTAPAVTVDRSSQTDARSSLVSVTGALADEPLYIGSVDDSERPLLSRDAVSLDRLSVNSTMNTSFSLALSALPAESVGDEADDETVAIGGFTILSDVSGGELSNAEFTFTVDADRLDMLDLSPENVELQREVDGEWVSLDTTVLNAMGERYQFEATSPGFSRFAIVGTTGEESTDEGDGETKSNGNAAIAVTEATVDATTVESGESLQVTATVENQGESNESFRTGLELDGEVVEIRDIDVAPGDSETVQFRPTLEETVTVEIAVNGTKAGEINVEKSADDGDQLDVDEESFTVVNVRLNETSIEPGKRVMIEADVLNEGNERADFIAELEVEGEVIDTFDVPQVPAGEDIPLSFTHQFDEEGTYTISISGNEADSELEVGQDGLFSFLGLLPLGFIPVGLIRTVMTFVGIPLLFVYLVLKAVAFYLGY